MLNTGWRAALLMLCVALSGCAGTSNGTGAGTPPIPRYFNTTTVQVEGNLSSDGSAQYSLPISLYDVNGRNYSVTLNFTRNQTLPTTAPAGAVSAWTMSTTPTSAGSVDGGDIFFDSQGISLTTSIPISIAATGQSVRIDCFVTCQPGASTAYLLQSFATQQTANVTWGGNLSTTNTLEFGSGVWNRTVNLYDSMANKTAVTLTLTLDGSPPSTAPTGCETAWAYVAVSSSGETVGTGELYFDAHGVDIPKPSTITMHNTDGSLSPQVIAMDFSKVTTGPEASGMAPTGQDGGPWFVIRGSTPLP